MTVNDTNRRLRHGKKGGCLIFLSKKSLWVIIVQAKGKFWWDFFLTTWQGQVIGVEIKDFGGVNAGLGFFQEEMMVSRGDSEVGSYAVRC